MSTTSTQDIYPGSAMAAGGQAPTLSAASGQNAPDGGPHAPALSLLGIVAVLVLVRLVYEWAPSGGKGI